MSRPLRIEYPGAWYHLMNRGRRRENIVEDDGDRLFFLTLLQEAAQLWDIRVAAFCLMDNHYHLLLQTPQGNLSRFMRHFNGVYTQGFNRAHNYDGQLFRGRYKSILVSEGSYLLELVKYIHRNPLSAGITSNLKDYPWSSYQGYLSKAWKWDWLHKDFILSMLDGRGTKQQQAFLKFMGEEVSEKLQTALTGRKWPNVLGDDDFVTWVKETFFQNKKDRQVPESFRLSPDREQIIRQVCRVYAVDEKYLLTVRRGRRNEARDLTLYLCRILRNDTLSVLGKYFGMTGYGPAGRAIDRCRKRLSEDLEFTRRMEEVKMSLSTSQVRP